MKSKEAKITLARGERILAVVPQIANGPGWSNQPVWVYIGSTDGTFRQVCIQPGERTAALSTLFSIGESVHRSLLYAVPTRNADD